ncbi:hypothetical protein D3C81_1675500 [compost metagenome]
MQAGHDIRGHAGRHGRIDAGRGAVFGKQHDGAALVARGDDDVLENVARVRFGIDDDEVRLQLRDALGKVEVGWQRGDDVEARFQQADAQGIAALHLGSQGRILVHAVLDNGVDDNDAQRLGTAGRHGSDLQWLNTTIAVSKKRTSRVYTVLYFRVGMANSAPAAVDAGQRCVTAFCFV